MNIKSYCCTRAAIRNKTNKTMKKNLIYSVIFLLCGTFFFSSCEDMLNVESNRVEYEFDDWTFNDSVYSVLGILKSVQKVGDKYVLLNELRGDLLSTNERTLDDEYAISNFDFDVTNNKYLDAKDYFTVINNCNVYLARVDTTLQYDNQRLMLREYVAVKSIRAWTYLQLIKNYAYIPFFTDPVLTHSKAEEIMSAAPADQYTVLSYLIDDIEKFQDPNLYKMPLWEIPNFVTVEMTKKLFMPIRVLLGDLYLWRASLKSEMASYPLQAPNPDSDYAKAAKCYYTYLAKDNTFNDNINTSSHGSEKPDDDKKTPSFGFRGRFAQKDFSTQGNNMVAIIHYAKNSGLGEVSNLASVFAPKDEIGTNQVVASPSIIGLSNRQTYIYRDNITTTTFKDYVVTSKNFPGDLRLASVTASQRGEDLNKTIYPGVIIKHNLEASNTPFISDDRVLYNPTVGTENIILDRPELVYIRFAEALMGLEREGYSGAKELAMEILKSGAKEEYKLYWNPDTTIETRVNEFGTVQTAPLLDAKGTQVKKVVVEYDEEGNETTVTIPQVAPIMDVVIASKDGFEPLVFDFSLPVFDENKGIHSRGSGTTEDNHEYELSDSCIAKYYGIAANDAPITVVDYMFNADGSLKQVAAYDGEEVKYDEEGNAMWEYHMTEAKEVLAYDVPAELYISYMYDKLIDELALEGAWEGHRFGDLARMAIALGEVDFLAKRVAARNVSTADWRTAETAEGWDAALYAKLVDKNNWYMPLPDNYLIPTIVPVTPDPETPVTPPAGEDTEEGEGTEEGNGTVESEPVTPPAVEEPSESEEVIPAE